MTQSGLDRIAQEGAAVAGLDRGARVALLAHAASVDRSAREARAVLTEAGLEVVRLFAPEHGVWGHEQDMEGVADATDPRSGLPVTSLYGNDVASLSPAPEQLEGLDAIVCDLQDVGSRYYTYVYTLSYLMEVAGKVGVPVVVLDRPNPIGGVLIEGPVLERDLASFVGRFPLPVRHGMTIGELAGWFTEVESIRCELRVVEMSGWRRAMSFAETGLPWVAPSPNMPTPTTALVYPGGCLVEGTELSEGRGTTTPFELVGQPGLDADALVHALRAAKLPGALFRPASFRPMFQKHAGQACLGVQVIPIDPDAFRPFATYVVLIAAARRIAGDAFGWREKAYEFVEDELAIDLLLGRRDLRAHLESGEPIGGEWDAGLAKFAERRAGLLRY